MSAPKQRLQECLVESFEDLEAGKPVFVSHQSGKAAVLVFVNDLGSANAFHNASACEQAAVLMTRTWVDDRLLKAAANKHAGGNGGVPLWMWQSVVAVPPCFRGARGG